MKNNRREFIKAGALGAMALTTGSVAAAEDGAAQQRRSKSLEILVLGGTGFIGPHMVSEALRRGHSVTLFNRGRSNSGLFPDLETIKGDRDNGLDGLKGRRWDAVIDNSGYVPRHVRDSTRLLANNTDFYLFISTISTYASFATPNDEDSPLATIDDETIEEVTGPTYGPLKALCEKRAREEIGDDRLAILRPTFICGPGDHTDRFSYWPVRTAKGGEMIWPGGPSYPTQIIDVRDLANFTVDCIEKNISGIYNTVTPVGSYTIGDLLEESQAVTGSSVDPVWVDEEFIEAAQANSTVQNWGLFPIWHSLTGDSAAVSSISGARAREAGLRNRPVRETIRDLMRWWETLPEERTVTLRAGMSADAEAELIALWKKENA
jgi:2'-hydroxyisoflavone reductase